MNAARGEAGDRCPDEPGEASRACDAPAANVGRRATVTGSAGRDAADLAASAPPTGPGAARPSRAARWLQVGLAFALGALAVRGVAVVVAAGWARAREPARAAWWRLRAGGVPSRTGVVLTVGLAPGGLAPGDEGPAGGGPWVVAWLENTTRAPLPLTWRVPAGGEVGARAWTAAGEEVPPAPPDAPSAGGPLHTAWLAPGQRLGVPVDLGARLALPGPGRYRVVLDRAPFGDPRGLGADGHRCWSEPTWLDLPGAGAR